MGAIDYNCRQTKKEFEEIIVRFAHPIRNGNWTEVPPSDAHQRYAMLTLTRTYIAQYLKFYQQDLKIA